MNLNTLLRDLQDRKRACFTDLMYPKSPYAEGQALAYDYVLKQLESLIEGDLQNSVHANDVEGGGWFVSVAIREKFVIDEVPPYGGMPQRVKQEFETLEEAIKYGETKLL